jgi:hypothetical protein
MSSGSPHVPAVAQVLAFELISDRFPLFKAMAKELTAFREEELPQFSRNKLRAHMAASATTPPIFFDICSPSRFPSAGDALPAVTETEACG